MCLEPSTSNLMFIRVREFSELFAVRPPPNLFICVNQTLNFSRPATIRLIIHRVPSVGRNVGEFSMSFAPRIEFEFLKPCFLFSFIFSRISRTQIHEFSTYVHWFSITTFTITGHKKLSTYTNPKLNRHLPQLYIRKYIQRMANVRAKIRERHNTPTMVLKSC